MRMGRFSVKEKKLILFVQDFSELLFYSYLLACRGQEDEAERRSSRMPRHRGQYCLYLMRYHIEIKVTGLDLVLEVLKSHDYLKECHET